MEFQFKDPKNSYLRDIFVFASFTALSFVDIKELSNDQIVEVNGEKWIISKRHKTGVPFQVKLMDIPLQIIERYKAFQENNLVFPNLNYWSICKRMGKMMHHQENQLSLLKARVCDPGPQQRDANRECQPYFGAYKH